MQLMVRGSRWCTCARRAALLYVFGMLASTQKSPEPLLKGMGIATFVVTVAIAAVMAFMAERT